MATTEVRFLLQDRQIPVFRDGRTKQVYITEDGFHAVQDYAAGFKSRQVAYYHAPIHPAFESTTDENTS